MCIDPNLLKKKSHYNTLCMPFFSTQTTHTHPTFAYTQRQGPDLVVELLVTGVEGL